MTQEKITMSQKDISRYDIIMSLIRGETTTRKASLQLSLSSRQTRRLKRKVEESGAKGLIHGNTGRESNNKIPPDIRNAAVSAIKDNYHDFGPTLAAEKLSEEHNINLSIEKVRALMIAHGIWMTRAMRKNKEHREWRERRSCIGEMQQFDGSHHDWFEDRGPKCRLLASIDDAGGKITKAKFAQDESTDNVFDFWREYIEHKGSPLSIYLDRSSTHKVNHKNAEDNKDMITQFQRAMKELGVEVIIAYSPQAKGRVERLFETLQDRLVKEMRLRGISTIEEANEFLEKEFIPEFNQRFSVLPKEQDDVHRKLSASQKEKLPSIFSKQYKRVVDNDFTVRFKNNFLQLEASQPVLICKRDKVYVEEHLDGELKLKKKDRYLNFELLSQRPTRSKTAKKVAALSNDTPKWRPADDHPWKKFRFGKAARRY
jgi:hypothetical protein